MTQPEPPSAALTLAVLQEALAQARQARDHPVEQNIHLLLARELERVKQYEEALLAYAEASVLSLFTGDAVARLGALIGEGMLYLRERKAELARDKFTAGLALTREQGNYLDEAEVLNLLAQAHTQLAHFELGADQGMRRALERDGILAFDHGRHPFVVRFRWCPAVRI